MVVVIRCIVWLSTWALIAAWVLPALAQERRMPDAPPPVGIVRSPGQVAPASPSPAPVVPTPAAGHAPRRATSEAFGERLAIEVRGVPTAEADAALRAAVEAIREVEELVDPWGDGGSGISAINATPGSGSSAADERLVELVARALSFCEWSRGAHGPLGGRLYLVWGFDGRARGMPPPEEVRQAAGAASCDGVTVDVAAATIGLAPGRRLDLRGFSRGFAVDRAFEELRRRGVENLIVEIGGVRRVAGDGPDGRGWPIVLPLFAGMERPLDRLDLRDRALALVSTVHRPLLVGGDRLAPWLDQRDGRPVTGVVATAAATELAVDAEALAVALTALGNREGLLRLGTLEPTPAVLWLLGDGEGQPLEAPYRWTGLDGS